MTRFDRSVAPFPSIGLVKLIDRHGISIEDRSWLPSQFSDKDFAATRLTRLFGGPHNGIGFKGHGWQECRTRADRNHDGGDSAAIVESILKERFKRESPFKKLHRNNKAARFAANVFRWRTVQGR